MSGAGGDAQWLALAQQAVGDVQPSERAGFQHVAAGALAAHEFAIDPRAQVGLAARIVADAHAVHFVAFQHEVDLGGMRQRGEQCRDRAVAIGEMHGAGAGLDALDSLDATLLEDYQPYHAARADLLARAGRPGAPAAYDRALELTANLTERRFLEQQRKATADRA